MSNQQQSFQQQLESAGVPVNLARQCSEILSKDDATKQNLGRSDDEQHLIRSAYEWMKAKS
jgi:hypothetical protein